jgi:hypothetical protein
MVQPIVRNVGKKFVMLNEGVLQQWIQLTFLKLLEREGKQLTKLVLHTSLPPKKPSLLERRVVVQLTRRGRNVMPNDLTATFEDAIVIRETEQAILVRAPEIDEDVWVPKSQIDEDSEVFEMGTEGALIVARWLALKNGWIDD